MPGRDQAISAALAEVFLAPDGGQPILLGIVEEFRATDQPASENLMSLGRFTPADNVVNQTQGQVSWSRVHTLNPEQLQRIIPVARQFSTYRRFNVLVVDPTDGRPIALCVGVLPTSLDTTFTNGRAARENYTCICLEVVRGDAITAQ